MNTEDIAELDYLADRRLLAEHRGSARPAA
jgi:hypothetical protein